jgi:hypothetical protein
MTSALGADGVPLHSTYAAATDSEINADHASFLNIDQSVTQSM